jgi:hypothetical protein
MVPAKTPEPKSLPDGVITWLRVKEPTRVDPTDPWTARYVIKVDRDYLPSNLSNVVPTANLMRHVGRTEAGEIEEVVEENVFIGNPDISYDDKWYYAKWKSVYANTPGWHRFVAGIDIMEGKRVVARGHAPPGGKWVEVRALEYNPHD